MADPLLTLPDAATYAAVSITTLRKHYGLAETNPRHLQAIKHYGQIKIRQSWLDDWINRTADAA